MWIQKHNKYGKVSIPVRQKPYNLNQLSDDDIRRIKTQWVQGYDVEKYASEIQEFLAQFEYRRKIVEAGYEVIDPIKCDDQEIKRNVKNNELVMITPIYIDTCGNPWVPGIRHEGRNEVSFIWTENIDRSRIPLLKQCKCILDSIVNRASHEASFHDGMHAQNIRKDGLLMLQELNKKILYDADLNWEEFPPLSAQPCASNKIRGDYVIYERTWLGEGKFFIDNLGFCYTMGSVIPSADYHSWKITDDSVNEAGIHEKGHMPLPLALKPILDYLFAANDRAHRHQSYTSVQPGPNTQLATWIHSLQPFASWFFELKGSDEDWEKVAKNNKIKEEEKARILAETQAKEEAVRLAEEHEKQHVLEQYRLEKERQREALRLEMENELARQQTQKEAQIEQLRFAMEAAERAAESEIHAKRTEYLRRIEQLDS